MADPHQTFPIMAHALETRNGQASMLTANYVTDQHRQREEELANRLNADNISVDDVDTVAAEHPEGRKRGGVVAVYEEGDAQVFYDETAEEWCGYNN